MAPSIIPLSAIDFALFSFGQLKTLDSGGKSVSVQYNGRNLRVQVPSLRLPFGANFYNKTTPFKWSVDLSLGGADDNPEIATFKGFLERLDARAIDLAVANNMAWFKKNSSRETITDNYTPLVKYSLDDKGERKPYPPNFKLTLKNKKNMPFVNENDPLSFFDVAFYDGTEPDELTPYAMDTPVSSVLCRGGYATAIAELTGMWVVGTKFGYSWKMIQGRVDSTGEDLKGPAFTVPDPKEVRSFVSKKTATVTANRVKEEEAEDDTGEEPIPAFTTMTLAPTPAPAPAPTPAPTPAPAPAVEESEEITEPLPVPKKTVVKKVVKPAAKA